MTRLRAGTLATLLLVLSSASGAQVVNVVTAVVDGARDSLPVPAPEPVLTFGQARRAAARTAMNAQGADMVADLAERSVWNVTRSDPWVLMQGIKLTGAERLEVNSINRRFAWEFGEARKEAIAVHNAGMPDPWLIMRVDAMRRRAQGELREALPAAKQVRYDRNAAGLRSRKN
jgi:hypothetical protein